MQQCRRVCLGRYRTHKSVKQSQMAPTPSRHTGGYSWGITRELLSHLISINSGIVRKGLIMNNRRHSSQSLWKISRVSYNFELGIWDKGQKVFLSFGCDESLLGNSGSIVNASGGLVVRGLWDCSSPTRDRIWVPCIGRWIFSLDHQGGPPNIYCLYQNITPPAFPRVL